jgi:HD superfamily phosphohydrolase
MAGLCNDLGQGIYSHLFDRHLVPTLAPTLKWDYKDASVMMFEHMIDQNNLEIDEYQRKRVCELIRGTPSSCQGAIGGSSTELKKKAWLFDIVTNRRNSIDVDKFDYIMRDMHNLGLLDNPFDPFRLI